MLGLQVLDQGHFRLLAHQPSRHAPDLLLRISTSTTSPQSGKPCATVALGGHRIEAHVEPLVSANHASQTAS